MNTFATLLLAFPFYLALKGKLPAYVDLAKPTPPGSQGTGDGVASTSSAGEKGATASSSVADASQSGSNSSADLLANAQTFAEIVGAFTA